jgi:surface polysaccharide O-acyltransferase-like enzyme
LQITSRNILLDILKIISALSVVAIHCGFLIEYNDLTYQIVTNGIFRIAVPLFFCINGFFLFNVFKSDRIKIWAKRVLILYLVWMLIYSYFWVYLNDFNLLKIIPTLLFGFNHLWYLAALLLGGLVLYKFREASNKILIISSILLFLIGITIQYLGQYHVFSQQPLIDKFINYPPIHRNFLLFAFPLLSIGYVIKRTNSHTKLKKKTVITLLTFSLLLLVVDRLIGYYYFTNNVTLNMNLSFLLLSPVLLITAFTFNLPSKLNSKLLSSFSIAIYLVHPLIIFFIFNMYNLPPTATTFVTIVLSIIVSYLLILLNRKLKYIL